MPEPISSCNSHGKHPNMNHLVLLGDSIFDNRRYVEGGPAVIDQVSQRMPLGWKASLLAVDGDTSTMALKQLPKVPPHTTHLVLSVGGNDALGCIPGLETAAASVKQGLGWLNKVQTEFRTNYQALTAALLALNKPLMVCTVYDSVPGMPKELGTALGLFNDVILKEAIQQGMPVLDLRLICTEPDDYSKVSPIEPSSAGGAKVAESMVRAITQHDFSQRMCRVYGQV